MKKTADISCGETQLVEYYSLHGKRNAYRKGDVFTRQKEKAADTSE